MGDQHQHNWSREEEIALFEEADAIAQANRYSRKSHLYERLVDKMNERFPDVDVTFTRNIIKNKVDTFKSRWMAGRALSSDNRVQCSERVSTVLFGQAISGSETTNSVPADSVNVNNDRTFTINEGIKLVESVEGLTEDERLAAANLMVNDDRVREAFLSFTNEGLRLSWIKGRLGTA